MKAVLRKCTQIKNRLTRLQDNEPVTKLALVIILLLDVFVLSIIFGGLEDHTQQLTSPGEYFPSACRRAFISQQWTQANRMDKLQRLVLTDYNRYSYRHKSIFSASRISDMHPACQSFYQQARAIVNKEELKAQFVKRQSILNQKKELAERYDKQNEAYDSSLLETIAHQQPSQRQYMAEAMKDISTEIDRREQQLNELDNAISQEPAVAQFWTLIFAGDAGRRETLIQDLNRFEKIYLFRELLWQLLFLAPLLAVFWLWHSGSIKKKRALQGLIAAHLIIVAAIPVLFKVIEVALELIPFHFFEDLFSLLQRLHIIALWHYGVILLGIALGAALIMLSQKKLFNKERLYQKRISKGACFACGKGLPGHGSAACPFCGAAQVQPCTACGRPTHIQGSYCTSCGEKQHA